MLPQMIDFKYLLKGGIQLYTQEYFYIGKLDYIHFMWLWWANTYKM